MADTKTCEFCGAPVVWEQWQINLDLALALQWPSVCTGLGVVCDACNDKIVQQAIAEMEREEREEPVEARNG